MISIRSSNLPLVLLAGSLGPLGFALVSQYFFGQPPCHLCLLQRYPYLAVALCGLGLFLRPDWRSLLVRLAILGWLTTASIGAYHTAVEEKWVTYHGGCVASNEPVTSLEDLREQIASAPHVSCDQPMGRFLGLSMASWNTLNALGWIGLALYISRRSLA